MVVHDLCFSVTVCFMVFYVLLHNVCSKIFLLFTIKSGYSASVGPEWAAVNMAITLCQNCAGQFVLCHFLSDSLSITVFVFRTTGLFSL